MFDSRYASKPVVQGVVAYTPEEDATWAELWRRLQLVIQSRAAPEVLAGLERLALPASRVPQIAEVNDRLALYTGFELVPVPAMIGASEFFNLLASRRFPVATFIRRWEELEYVQEPDVFHEIFGHAPLLTEPRYADALESFGRTALELGPAYFDAIQRLFWFTVEFGLVRNPQGNLRFYGAGIGSSARETVSCLEDRAQRRPFDARRASQTAYEIDRVQPLYFVLDSLDALYTLASTLRTELPRFPLAA